MVMTSPSSVVNTDLPKWQPILLNTNPININGIGTHSSTSSRLIFGLTPPTVALIALAIVLCILVEILSNKVTAPPSSSSSSDLDSTVIADYQYRKQPISMMKYWNNIDQQPAGSNSKVSSYKKKAFFSQMLGFEMICSFVLKGVLDFEKAAVEGNL